MVKTLLSAMSTNNADGVNGNRYNCVGNCTVGFDYTTESFGQTPFRVAGTGSYLSCYVSTNTRSTATTCRLRINAGNVNQTVSVPASTTGAFSDTTHTDSIAASDLLTYAAVIIAGTGSCKFNGISMAFDASSGNGSHVFSICSLSNTWAIRLVRQLSYYPFAGFGGTATGTESNVAQPVKAMTTSYLYSNITVNGGDATSTFQLRKNTAAANQVLSIGAGTTGIFTDTTHTDSFSDGDTIDLLTDTSTSTVGTLESPIAALWADVTSVQSLISGQQNGNLVIAASPTVDYINTTGNCIITTTESFVSFVSVCTGTWANLGFTVNVTFNSGANIRSRINGSNGQQNVSITAATSGRFTDTTHTDTVNAGQVLSVSFAAVSGGGQGMLLASTFIEGGTPYVPPPPKGPGNNNAGGNKGGLGGGNGGGRGKGNGNGGSAGGGGGGTQGGSGGGTSNQQQFVTTYSGAYFRNAGYLSAPLVYPKWLGSESAGPSPGGDISGLTYPWFWFMIR